MQEREFEFRGVLQLTDSHVRKKLYYMCAVGN
jgi:hypothetical protein